jgi:hypothetical protein
MAFEESNNPAAVMMSWLSAIEGGPSDGTPDVHYVMDAPNMQIWFTQGRKRVRLWLVACHPDNALPSGPAEITRVNAVLLLDALTAWLGDQKTVARSRGHIRCYSCGHETRCRCCPGSDQGHTLDTWPVGGLAAYVAGGTLTLADVFCRACLADCAEGHPRAHAKARSDNPVGLLQWEDCGIERVLGYGSSVQDHLQHELQVQQDRERARALALTMAVECPYCGSPIGEVCLTSPGRQESRPHRDRGRLARSLLDGTDREPGVAAG